MNLLYCLAAVVITLWVAGLIAGFLPEFELYQAMLWSIPAGCGVGMLISAIWYGRRT